MGALAQRADELYEGLTEAEQGMTRQLFLRLITLGESNEDTRRRVLRSELEALTPTLSQRARGRREVGLASIINQFGRYRLLTFDHDPVTRGPSVEVAHEALLREWRRL